MTIPLSLQEEGDNEDTRIFDLVAWIKLSKLRCHLAVRHSKDLNYKFQKLFPRTQMEPPVRLRMLQEKATHLAVVKRHYNRYDFVLYRYLLSSLEKVLVNCYCKHQC